MSLADFLLARIAEDEERTRGTEWAEERASEERRTLVECEAKRQLLADPALRVFIDADRETARLSKMGARILGYLALPYADHPDYREEWKP